MFLFSDLRGAHVRPQGQRCFPRWPGSRKQVHPCAGSVAPQAGATPGSSSRPICCATSSVSVRLWACIRYSPFAGLPLVIVAALALLMCWPAFYVLHWDSRGHQRRAVTDPVRS
jgi:hypothetical protein